MTGTEVGSREDALGTLVDKRLAEASGLALGTHGDDVLFTHGDSGTKAAVYAIDSEGRLLAEYRMPDGIDNVDWEDIAIAPGPDGKSYLYVGDIGDNVVGDLEEQGREKGSPRPNITVYRFPEPQVPRDGGGKKGAKIDIDAARVERIELTYPDAPRNAETLLVDPLRGELLIVRKNKTRQGVDALSEIYAAPTEAGRHVLQRIGAISFGEGALEPFDDSGRARRITGGDISRDGKRLALRTYGGLFVWDNPKRLPWGEVLGTAPSARLALPEEAKGEAVAFAPDGEHVLTVSERVKRKKAEPLRSYRLPG